MCQVITDATKSNRQLKEIHIFDPKEDFFIDNVINWRDEVGRKQIVGTREINEKASPGMTYPPAAEVGTISKLVPCGFIIANKVQVFIHQCDITKLQVDAIAYIGNEILAHDGGIAKTIFDAAGPPLEKEVKSKANSSNPISVNDTVITSAGELPCEMVIHAVCSEWPFEIDNHKKQQCLTILHNAYNKILHTADEYCLETLAVSAITSGENVVFKFIY